MNKKMIRTALEEAKQSVSKVFDESRNTWIVQISGPSGSREFTSKPCFVNEVLRVCVASEAVRSLHPDHDFEDVFVAVAAATAESTFMTEVSFWLRMKSPLVKRAIEILDRSRSSTLQNFIAGD